LLNSLLLGSSANLELSEPLSLLGVLLDELRSSLNLSTGNLTLLGGRLPCWVSSDLGVSGLVDLIEASSLEELLPLAELFAELSGLLGLEQVVVLLDVDTKDVLQVLFGAVIWLRLLLLFDSATLLAANVSLGLLPAEAGESLFVMGHVDATVTGTLHGTEDSVTGGGADETNIEVCLEGASVTALRLNVVHSAISSGDSSESGVDGLHLEKSTGEEEASGVGGSIVGQTSLDSVAGELLGVGGADGHISLQGGVVDGREDALVGEADDKSVLLGVVLILVVDDESLTGVIVGLTLSSASELGLVPLRVGLILQDFNVTHC